MISTGVGIVEANDGTLAVGRLRREVGLVGSDGDRRRGRSGRAARGGRDEPDDRTSEGSGAGLVGKLGYRLIGLAFAIPSGMAVKKALDAGWRRSRGSDPPRDPKALDVHWLEALAWAGVSAVVIAGAEIASTRGAARAYRALTGRPAPGTEPEHG